MTKSPRPEQRLGAVLDGKYELLRLLGSGASGAVYAARHQYTERDVAVKILHAHLLDSREHVGRFLREARIAASIHHPNVALVLDAGRVEPDGPYMVTELLEGEELYKRMKRGPMVVDDAIEIVRSLLLGLHAAHEAGVIHRDVKPENVFLAGSRPPSLGLSGVTVKVIDFGIAKRRWSPTSMALTAADRTVGTPLYMSPEQIRGTFVDGRTDVWAVGVMMHELLTGHPPFVEHDMMTLLLRVVRERPPSIQERCGGLPAYVVRAVDRALEPKPEDRFPTAKAMAEALVRP